MRVYAGDNTITHHVDWTLERSLLGREERGENSFNEQQVTERERQLKGGKTETKEAGKTKKNKMLCGNKSVNRESEGWRETNEQVTERERQLKGGKMKQRRETNLKEIYILWKSEGQGTKFAQKESNVVEGWSVCVSVCGVEVGLGGQKDEGN